ncbi:hypothetical protein KR093_009063, partial [Drosophila rubida]
GFGFRGRTGYGPFNPTRPGYGGGQPPFGYQQPEQGYPGRPFQPRPVDASGAQQPDEGRVPAHQRPGQVAGDFYGYQQPEQSLGRRPLQPRPEQGNSFPGGFQTGTAGSRFQPRPGQGTSNLYGYQQPEQSLDGSPGRPLQPRPDQGIAYPGGQQSGSVGGTLQPRPGQGSGDIFGYQQPEESLGGRPLQPRPDQGIAFPGGQQSGSVGGTLQPRPGQGSGDIFGHQQPEQSLDGSAARPLQPRPAQGTSFPGGFQTGNVGGTLQPRPEAEASDALGGNTGGAPQPRPGQGQVQQSFPIGLQQPGQGSVGGTLQPRPEATGHDQNSSSDYTARPQQQVEHQSGSLTDRTVDENILSIFSTNDFLSPHLKEGDSKDGTAAGDAQLKSIDGRFLFSTDPKCKDGKDVRDGRCRPSA